ncbi:MULTISPECIES: proton-conducting transporter membrane subunit [Rhodopseudomonas]|uniref:NADH-quinone oxidoreductase subunit N n=1 Tax=Rhodopseudomonas palustris TaxID=1076 RepID=A0A0D7ECK6_RHOPL|nr:MULTISPECIES: proton-conducting transporter membrane subunit [Rhodopseudomonas]KIZ38579.1 NADH-quinone oxidoreductase subunit N [Rhodopseudomonas palustris]MDF3813858.1 proton-conducting transporter membrane subunit [Rhodopseudomonas sp. BAL398]WOK15449.1 proton-conducting transporter membrane subunit [Rhodopseudomonas sp. BAL398]
MNAAQLAALSPIGALAIGAVAAMMLAPLARAELVRAAAALSLALAAGLVLLRAGASPAPIGTLYMDDGPARFGIVYASLSSLAALVFLRGGSAKEAPSLLVLAALGAATLAAAGHAATLFLGIEIISLSLIALFAFLLSRPGLEASYKFLVMSGLATAALLLGVALIYAETGALAFAGWSGHGALFALGTALLLAGLAFKFSLAPFHMWTPDAFEGAPAGAAALAGVVSKGAVAVAILRLNATAQLPEPLWSSGLAALGAASILVGNLLALRQPALPRMLGYSTIAHSGYIAVLLAAASPRADEAVLFYLAIYAPALIGALCASALLGKAPTLPDLHGLVRRRPLEAAALSLALLSLAGLPAAGGFIAKLYLFRVLVETGGWTLLGVVAAGSGLGFYYYARFFTAPFIGVGAVEADPLPLGDRALLMLCAALIVLFGVAPGLVIDIVTPALSLR